MKCANCGAEFDPHNSLQIYCSLACRVEAGKERDKAARRALNPGLEMARKTGRCERCGE